MHCYLDGKIIPESEAKVSIFDIGLLRGFGVYEAMAGFGLQVFKIDDHLARFRTSAAFLNITVPATDDEIKKIIRELLHKNGFAQGNNRSNIKFILTGGTAIKGIQFDPAHPTFYIFTEAWKPLAEEYYTNGAKLITAEYLRENPGYKTTDYINAVSLQKSMQEVGALEAVYIWQGKVLECTTSNIFIVSEGVVSTPSDNVLHGITRNATLQLLREHRIPCDECDISEGELYAAQECFITSSFKDIVPVVSVGGQTIGSGTPGQVTRQIMQLFEGNLPKG